MWKIIVFVPIVFAFSLRCSHTAKHSSINPPYQSEIYRDLKSKDPESVERYFSKYKTNETDTATRYWVKYKLGQVWKKVDQKKSCDYFKELSAISDFPLNDLAYLQTIEVCDGKSIESRRLFEMKNDDSKKWLLPEIYRLQYQFAKENNIYPEKADAALELSKDSLIRPEKIAYTKEALAWARGNKDEERISLLNKRIEKLSPSKIKNPKKDQLFDVAYDFRRDRKFEEAIATYKKIGNNKRSSVEEKMKAWRGVAKSYKLMRDKERHIKALYSVASIADRNFRKNKKSKHAARLHHDAQIGLARALWTQGEVSKARKILEIAANWLKGKYPTDQVHWLLARMAEEKADYNKAIHHAKISKEEAKSADSSYYEKSSWIVAWNLKKIGQPKEAIDIFKDLYQKTDNPYDAAKYKFWYAHSLSEADQKLDAYQVYKELSLEDPLGYYGLLAYRQRGESFPDVVKSSGGFADDAKLELNRSLLSEVEWLISLGETRLAQSFLKELKIKPKNNSERRKLYDLYGKAGYFAGIFRDLASLSPEDKTNLVQENPEYLFPRPYLNKVNEVSSSFGVEPALVYSIIRQESSFIPHARSFADAFGLMQLIPKQAKRLAGKHDVDYEEPEDLYEPDVNLELGIAFLRELWDRKQGQFVMTVASYNASEKAVRGWINTRYNGDPITWIEDIPYSETKGYIKLVLRNFIWYKRLSVKNQKVNFPEWALVGLEEFKSGAVKRNVSSQ